MDKTKYTTPEQIEAMREELLREKQKMPGAPTPGHSGKRRLRKRSGAFKAAGWMVFLTVVLLLTAAIISVQITKSRGDIPDILGFQLFVIESGSMEPTFDVGTAILCRKPKNAKDLKENDIVTFKSLSGAVVTHRIVEVINGSNGNVSYRTKGDNPRNSTDREMLTSDRVLAVFVAKIPLT